MLYMHNKRDVYLYWFTHEITQIPYFLCKIMNF